MAVCRAIRHRARRSKFYYGLGGTSLGTADENLQKLVTMVMAMVDSMMWGTAFHERNRY